MFSRPLPKVFCLTLGSIAAALVVVPVSARAADSGQPTGLAHQAEASTEAIATGGAGGGADRTVIEEKPCQSKNRLAREGSPYLRQHADNPVDWYPWSEEAFDKARRENKPILLSIGYSTCHWCHVMARESYSDAGVARILNNGFVAIKVDRERRPEVDETYMLATQYFAEVGGWPNNVFLTPDLKPFYGGVYFPKDAFTELLIEVKDSWATNREAVLQEADRVAALVDQVMTHRAQAREITPEALKATVGLLTSAFDSKHGGIGTAPKFPREHILLFLLDQAQMTNDKPTLAIVMKALDAILRGGIRDQVGGGVHRYAVDQQWRTPHYEIMLFNQANVVRALLQAYRITGDVQFEAGARTILDFVLREMRDPKGAFYSAFDAESLTAEGAKQEGYYYTWTREDLKAALPADDAALALRAFGFEADLTLAPRQPLFLPEPLADLAQSENMSEAALSERLDTIRLKLRDARTTRTRPHRDEKVLTSWNGLMIRAMAEAAVTFNDDTYGAAAIKAASHIWEDLGGADNALKRYAFEGKAELDATQPDYALISLAFLAVYDATENPVWLARAKTLTAKMHATFFDTEVGDYFMTAEDGFYRPKIMVETDLPSGNAGALEVFAKLARRDADPEHRAKADTILSAISGNLLQDAGSNAYGLRVANQFLRGETGPVRMIANGRVRAVARTAAGTEGEIEVTLKIAPGWHINADKPLDEFFIPTKLSLPDGASASVRYPKASVQTLGFHKAPLALYEGEVVMTVTPASGGMGGPREATLTVQTCSDQICLEPETVQLNVLDK
ncbi:MAG: DUF255 domain-containing protein [Pseudomonadota bacterium]